MSEHRRKPPQSRGRRAAQPPPSRGRRAAQPSGATTSSYGAGDTAAGGRAEARRAAGRGGRRRAAETTAHAAAGAGRGRRAEAPGKKRFIDYPRSGKYGVRRWVPSWKHILTLCVGFLGLLVGLSGLALAMVEVPNEHDAAKAQNNVFYWADGKVMGRDGETNRQNIGIDQMPLSLQEAVIAAENASFRTDSGVDPKGIARAVVNMARGQQTQGGSTITQQFVKNNFLSQEQTMSRKVKELFISIKVGTTRDKDEILRGYLNTAYFGRGAYGVQAAAQAYYGIDAEKLEPDQSAFLATLLKGADFYDPAGGEGPGRSPQENRKRAEIRWAWVLDRMVEVGTMAEADRAKYQEFPEPIRRQSQSGKVGQVGYLMELAKNEVLRKTGMDKGLLDRGGFQIHTTFERKKVLQLEKAVNKVRKEKLDPKTREKDKHVQFGAASVVPNDGAIVAVYGGAGFDKGHFFNNADSSGVQVGSTWKPFVLAAAMEHGTVQSEGRPITPESKYNGDNLLTIKNPDGSDYLTKDHEPFKQVNLNGKDWGYISLERAMEVSANTPFVQLGMDVGMHRVKEMAMAAGIREGQIDPALNPSFALGTSTPSAIRMADAYATFAASGTQTEPYSVTKVVANGQEMEGFDKPSRKSAIDPNVADNVTATLENVVQGENGSGWRARELGRPVAGKTGTTDKGRSAWWVGYTPQLSTSVAMFRFDPDGDRVPLSLNGTGGEDASGGGMPTQVFVNYMKEAAKGTPKTPFPKPRPLGEPFDQDGAPSETPTPTETPDVEESEEPEEPTEEPSEPEETPSPTESESCSPFDPRCNTGGNNNNGGGNNSSGGQDGGTTTEGSTSGQDGGFTEGTTDGQDTSGETDGSSGGGPRGGSGNGGTIFGQGSNE
ncbi:penicillin-binding protein [Streptomyces sp. OF3]|uniref:Penicillin-binding protein n=1 Tax=Streptomyces alkaliterrae TaxID=2213162 RepID=A0A7W3WNT9_9ACTN|nr:transglycosylase domain-containing protein [Streptomyces alkaliterrae]MBB1255753.1 penicillin-binding protein [Streptomyces alkaliterrae]